MPLHLAILGSTRGTVLEPIIDAIQAHTLDACVEIVISNKQEAYILERAKKHNIDARFVDNANKTRETFDAEVMKLLSEKHIDLILLIGYMRFLSKPFVDAYRGKILNVHPSLLPKFAGGMDMNVHQAVLDAGETESGCTIHEVDEGADTGTILMQKKCVIEENETADTLKKKVQQLEGEALIEVIKQYA